MTAPYREASVRADTALGPDPFDTAPVGAAPLCLWCGAKYTTYSDGSTVSGSPVRPPRLGRGFGHWLSGCKERRPHLHQSCANCGGQWICAPLGVPR